VPEEGAACSALARGGTAASYMVDGKASLLASSFLILFQNINFSNLLHQQVPRIFPSGM